MTSVIAALSFGGNWHIHDKDSIKTSFPNFLKIIIKLKMINKEKYYKNCNRLSCCSWCWNFSKSNF